jgi:hypothetical protein
VGEVCYSSVLELERAAGAAREVADAAAAYGDWDRAAEAEELAVLEEHKAALVRGG